MGPARSAGAAEVPGENRRTGAPSHIFVSRVVLGGTCTGSDTEGMEAA